MSGQYIQFTSTGSWSKTEAFLRKAANREGMRAVLEAGGQRGVDALRAATPKDSSETANAWSYEVTAGKEGMSIVWRNNHMAGSTPVVILLHYGHATGTGGYVQGQEFIKSTIKPIFDQIETEVLRVVTQG